jgi:CRP/FNR family transcriptional regulator
VNSSANNVVNLDALRRSCANCTLQQLCLPATVDADDLARIDSMVRKRRPLQRGDALYRQGDAMESLYVAREGAFKTVAVTQEGEAQILGFHLPGELMGFDALGSGQHQCDAEALGTAVVCEVPFDQLEEFASKVPGLRRQLLRVIGRSMDRDQAHVEMLGRRHATERVALFLHSLSERYRALGRRADQVDLPMSREDIGSYLGLAIETVSRTLGKLQDEGMIAVRGRRVTIVDSSALARLVHAGDPRRVDSA